MRIAIILSCVIFFLGSSAAGLAQEVRFDCSGYLWKKAGWQQEVEEESYFILSENGIELMHFTPRIVSFYFTDQWLYRADQNTLEAQLVSDADNRYRVLIDEAEGTLHFWLLDGIHKDAEVVFFIRK